MEGWNILKASHLGREHGIGERFGFLFFSVILVTLGNAISPLCLSISSSVNRSNNPWDLLWASDETILELYRYPLPLAERYWWDGGRGSAAPPLPWAISTFLRLPFTTCKMDIEGLFSKFPWKAVHTGRIGDRSSSRPNQLYNHGPVMKSSVL